ncbi:RtcB family protein [bacterium]|nr:RtcB family protein [bacterium]
MTLFDEKKQRIPLKIWQSDVHQIEVEALNQAINLTQLPFSFHQVALMPDAHVGYGMPIGGVLATIDAIIPFAVGMDIGCGMHTVRTQYTVEDFPAYKLRKFMDLTRAAIPQGFNWHKSAQKDPVFDKMPLHLKLFQDENKRIRKQLGTLGGGNHFIEIQHDEEGQIWIMLHSGSRNIGKLTAERYHRAAKDFCRKEKSQLPTSQLSYLDINTQEGQDYLDAMNWCLDFALASRTRMMQVILDILETPGYEELDIHHNYASREKHFGKNVWVHRKGATRAFRDERGIIPGSMGTVSYLVRGRGNPESFQSCSHGAGRRMGRKEAKRKIPVDQVLNEMKKLGVEISTDNLRDLAEEASQAYKNIDEVMEQQTDLVQVERKLTPLGVVKG